MNKNFDELTRTLAQSVRRRAALKKFGLGLAGMALAALLAPSTTCHAASLGPLLELSVPNAVGSCDDGFRLPGTMTVNDAAETMLVVNPANPNNLVAVWIQGPIQNNIAALSFDGGATWQQVPLPLTVCSGGSAAATGDPWLSFAPNGDLFCVVLVGPSPAQASTAILKSSDGGLHWSAPALVDTPDFAPDKTSITADPTDSRFAYAAWTRQKVKNRDDLAFSRTIDGGLTWEMPRSILQTVSGQQAYNSQILVLPDGTLVDMFYRQFAKPNQPVTQFGLQLMRSMDKGQTWSTPIPAVTMQTILRTDGSGFTLTVDPDTGQLVRDTTNPSFAVDNRSGNLYAVWEDGRFSNFQYNDIAFSMSSDGGFTWSSPIRVNQTPPNIAPLNRQAFYPIVAVANNGAIAVSYYDFRFNTSDPGVPTDYWLVQCHPSPSSPATNPASWGHEARLTSASFNLEALPIVIDGFWFGDYLGLAPVGRGFGATFGAVDQGGITSIFYRSVQQ
jgi:BNR repeat protein